MNIMNEEEEELRSVREKLETFASVDFNLFIPKTMLGLSHEEIYTIQFAFWFCYVVEHDLNTALQQGLRNMESVMGKTPEEVANFIKEGFEIRWERVDPDDPKYDPESITFNDRIDIVEKIRGRSDHTRFLRKIKKLRNDISHGRIYRLTYEGQDLSNNDTKKQLLFDYLKQLLGMENMESEGGMINKLTKEENARVEKLYREWLNKKQ